MGVRYKLVLSTCDSIAEARKIATQLVEQKLAACVNLIPTVESIYVWEGQVEQTQETKLLIKTKSEKLEQVLAAIRNLHSYDVPEIQVVDITGGNLAYFKWMDEVLL
ncbi:divalent-cation tolerance protein CutA [Pseudoalteromonas piscicida]|uniref:Divalent-cation tolerance protein CutA n=1 Tax=Pseudoalteromonas piscicida TaxID=43662 RepID=A0A2A5JW77_PSEO7|nr:divalent-cation tolerance protein CutA [Pseudoalteromonas piscicida]PCK33541.1 divalent-cation tolerance protein CutA [Pseudoalteromonas piscicida]